MTFKDDVFEVCRYVATEFDGWEFASGVFKNKSLKHSDLIINPGFYFDRGFTNIQPSVEINNKKLYKFSKKIIGDGVYASNINYSILGSLMYMPERLRLSCVLCEDKTNYLRAVWANSNDAQMAKILEGKALDVSEVVPILVAMMKDGIGFIEKHYDMSSEGNFLKGLPAKYVTRNQLPCDEMEKQKGVRMCLIHMLYGDFNFFERYCSDGFETAYPKRTADLDKIAAALPELKKRYAETGSVI